MAGLFLGVAVQKSLPIEAIRKDLIRYFSV